MGQRVQRRAGAVGDEAAAGGGREADFGGRGGDEGESEAVFCAVGAARGVLEDDGGGVGRVVVEGVGV